VEEAKPVSDDARRIEAYEVHNPDDMPIVRAPFHRDWMDATEQQFAYRCLPLVIANQAGWLIQNPADFTACWNGGPRPTDLTLKFGTDAPAGPFSFQLAVGASEPGPPEPQPPEPRITSHFGSGVLTFSLPYLFRTPPGINLWVKGPTNWIKDGVAALEGVVESDWSAATFTMNWKLTRPGLAVRFERGEPICMIVPVTRGLAEGLEPRQASLWSNKEVAAAYTTWRAGRSDFLQALSKQAPEAVGRGWQKDYFQGRQSDGTPFQEHQTRMRLKDFVRESS
jgi:hypothetical protein